jgi:hypothetical protein
MTTEQRKLHDAIAAAWEAITEMDTALEKVSTIKEKQWMLKVRHDLCKLDKYWNKSS